MENRKQLPAVLKMRAERILQKAIKAIYKDIGDPSIAECVLMDDTIKYVDLDRRKQVSLIAVDPKKAGKEDTEKLTSGNFHSTIKRPVVETAPDYVSPVDDDEITGVDMNEEAPKATPKKRQTKKTK